MSGQPFDYALDFKDINFRQRPDLSRVGKSEQGVLLVEPYKSEIHRPGSFVKPPTWNVRCGSAAGSGRWRSARRVSNYGVSEAVYLRAPDSNEVELYWDRSTKCRPGLRTASWSCHMVDRSERPSPRRM